MFEEEYIPKKFNQIIGYIFSYFMFTTMLYFILSALGRLPASWTYFNVLLLTFAIVIAGKIAGKLIK